MDVDPALIFNVPPDQMWEAAIRRLGADPVGAADRQRRRPLTSIDDLPGPKDPAYADDEICLWRQSLQRAWPSARRTVAAPNVEQLKTMTARFAPVDLTADITKLPANERQALAQLVEAAKVMDALFLRQVWAGNETMLLDLLQDTSPLGRARLHYFLINKGPWSRLDRRTSRSSPARRRSPTQANFYPAGATKDEVEAWITTLSGAQRTFATGFFTTIRRMPDGKFIAVPYSLEYQGELAHVAALLREAAALTTQPTLKAFLEKRAQAFLTNDYYDSDVAWMELDASIEPTIGPYEVYEDEWFNYKAAFEAFITRSRRRGDRTSWRASAPSCRRSRTTCRSIRSIAIPKLGALAPIRVVNTVFSSGDGNRGVQTAAFNLPNDERIIAEKGAKRVMLKNNQEAKFEKVLLPISKVALAAKDQANVAFDAFFTHILMHELMHGLGPHNIIVGGRPTTVRQELKETYSTIEEAKADISGLFALQFLVDRGKLDKKFEQTMYTTYLASMFRSIRFGTQRGARPRRRHPAQLLPRQRRRHRRAGRHVRRQSGAHQAERHRSHARPDDDAGRSADTRRRSR